MYGFMKLTNEEKKSLLHGSAECYCVDIKCLLQQRELLNVREVNFKKIN